MKKFIVHTRALPGCCKASDAPAIIEVEGEIITAIEDPSVMWMAKDEYMFRVLKPQSLYETQGQDKKLVPPIYASHSIFSSLFDARTKAYALVTHSFEFTKRKEKKEYTEEQVTAKCAEIQEILL